MSFERIKIEVLTGKDWQKSFNWRDRLLNQCPAMRFYLKPILRAYVATVQPQADEIIAEWERTAPRPVQREATLDFDDDSIHWILFGGVSGTGKTTVAYEKILRSLMGIRGNILEPDGGLPIALTGHEFARRVAGGAKDLDELMEGFIEADYLLLDDLDKRGDSAGKFSPIVQQTLFDLIEARTTQDMPTILTLNSNGEELLSKFDDDIGPYLLRRLRERFRSIDFDPELPATNNLQNKSA